MMHLHALNVLAMDDREAIIGMSIPIIAITGGLFVAVISIISKSVSKVRITKAREESRREIAAYVAEGSITPDDAIRMMQAGEKVQDGSSKSC